MSQVEEVQEGEEFAEVSFGESTPSGSLEARMAARAEEAEADVTEKWAVPGKFSDIIAVELRMLGWKTLRGIGKRHAKNRDQTLQELYVACDQIIAATVAFHEIVVDAEGAETYKELPGETWMSLARRGIKLLPQDLTPRQAMLALIKPDTLVPLLLQEWMEWMKDRRPDVDREVGSDFGMTG